MGQSYDSFGGKLHAQKHGRTKYFPKSGMVYQLKAMKDQGKRIPAERVVAYHQRAGENVPIYQERRVMQQGESFDLPILQLER